MGVKIKGEEYPIRPTMWALLQFKRDKEKDVSDLKDTDLEDMLYYTWLCVKGACVQSERDFDMSFDDYVKYVEGDPTEALIIVKFEDIKKKGEKH
jgi:hypothetical protein